MKRLLELAWALLCAWMIHGIYRGSKERAAAAAHQDAGARDDAPGQPNSGQVEAPTAAPGSEEHATREDKAAFALAGAVFLLTIVAVFRIDPSEFTRGDYLAAIVAVVGVTAVVVGVSKVVERFQPESRFFVTFERCLLLIAAIWASASALATVQAG